MTFPAQHLKEVKDGAHYHPEISMFVGLFLNIMSTNSTVVKGKTICYNIYTNKQYDTCKKLQPYQHEKHAPQYWWNIDI